MSDDESFVILGTSPMSSLETDGTETTIQKIDSSMESDTSGGGFSLLRKSQLNDLKCAQECITQTHLGTQSAVSSLGTSTASNRSIEETEQKNANSQLWSRPPHVQVEGNCRQLNLEDCALKSPHELQPQQKIQQESTLNEQTNKTTSSGPVDSNLAASFIMGEIKSDILKTSVYSQFPSISVEACPEDVLKLQNMVTEYSQLKSMIKKANNTMKLFYDNSLQLKEKMQTMEEDYKQQLSDCKTEILMLRQQNDELDKNMQTQIEALEIARKNDREEYIQKISEKSALLENMRVQIIKLEQQLRASLDIPPQRNTFYVAPVEQEQFSELLASKLCLENAEKQYVNELNCLKVNLTAAEELITKNCFEIIQLQSLNLEKDKQVEKLRMSFKSLQDAFEDQKEHIALLEAQNEVHRTDFEIEKQTRVTAVKEKQQMIQDLRSLQKRNQELIEEQQKLADMYQKKISSTAAITDAKINAASAEAQTYFNNPQRPIRILPSPTAPTSSLHMCPICNKGFKSLQILISHVDDCVDKN